MSDDKLVVLNNQIALAPRGGVGMGLGLFKSKPSYIELVPKSTRQEGAIPGTFRRMDSNERLGTEDEKGNIKDEIRVVLIAEPVEQREYYLNDGKTYSKEMKQCFSVDNVQPHASAKNAPAMYCATCPMGDINWKKWREGGKTPDLLPKCQKYWHLFIAERNTQVAYYLNIKGKSVAPFESAMKTQMASLLDRIMANAVMINKSRGYKFNKTTGIFDFVALPEGVTERVAPEPLPNIFDIAFTIYSNRKDGDIVMGFKDFARMKEEDRKEFGGLYDDFLQRKKEAQERYIAGETVSEEAQGDAVVTEAVDGEYVSGSNEEPITI